MRKEDWNGYKVMIVRSQRMIVKTWEGDDAGGAAGKGGQGTEAEQRGGGIKRGKMDRKGGVDRKCRRD